MPKLTVLKSNASALVPVDKRKLVGEGFDGLPTEVTGKIPDPLSLRWLAIAPPGWGKTEFFMQFPECLLLACEEGHLMVKGHKIVIDCFDHKGQPTLPWTDTNGDMHMSFVQAVSRILASNRFKFIIIDTVDALVKLITDFYEIKLKVDHIADAGEYGKGYDLGQNGPFRKTINQIVKSGRGVGFTTHQQVNKATFKAGERSKKETTLPGGIAKLLIPQVDIIVHGKLGKIREPNRHRDRIAVTEGTEETLAKNRGGILPGRFIVDAKPEKRWSQIQKFFTDTKSVLAAEAEHKKYYSL